ncbi:hypothetical protein [Paeniglutamicibacter terrestris]|uniref:PKD domain-containing protein n=1 Tax=Paeniglutamicibacter terrestris TaxID=2723403 RepID=A0ABX1G1J5_9MICC|nr:hypothetical protein [Paeniglutamicibacter terrestris]NKG19460.1 hypothetical protein [Paeniglutamicibacter terrestris]
MSVFTIVFALALMTSPFEASTFAAGENRCTVIERMGNSFIETHVKCSDENEENSAHFVPNNEKSKTISNGPKLRYSVNYYSECTPDLTLVLSCDAIADPTCPDGGYRTIRTIRAINGPRAGQIVSTTQYCSAEPPTTIPGAEDDIAKMTLADFRRLNILASIIISQPESFSLRNGNAHMFADAESQNFAVTIFDQNVRVRAIPVSYAWSYGDGATRSFSFPGQPMAQRGFDEPTTTSHVYTETGDFAVGLTTRFRGEYSTEGGPWTPIPGVANVPSEQITMSVWRTKKILVAENCNEGARTPGCASLFE